MNFVDIAALILFSAVSIAVWRVFFVRDPDVAVANTIGKAPPSKLLSCLAAKPQPDAKPAKGDDIEAILAKIARIDRGFSPQSIMALSKDLFEQCVEAFNAGDLSFVRAFLSPRVLASMQKELSVLKASKRTAFTEIVRFKKISLTGAELDEHSARVSIEIQTEQTALVRDARGKIVDGDENSVAETTDKWILSMGRKQRNAGWILLDIEG